MSDMQHGRFRHKTNFAAVSNTALQDSKLSLRAKGLYALIQSYINIPNYDLYKSYLQKSSIEGSRAFDSAWNELKERGYLKQHRIPGSNRGRFEYEYDLLDTPDMATPSIINMNYRRSKDTAEERIHIVEKTLQTEEASESPPEANSDHTLQNVPYGQQGSEAGEAPDHTLQNVPYGQDSSKVSEVSDHTLQKAPYAQSTICSEHHMLGAPHAKRGCISNTETNKTEINKNYGNNNQSISQSSGKSFAFSTNDVQTDEIRKSLIEQIDYEYFADNCPDDLDCINALVDCMTELLTSPESKINGSFQSRSYFEAYISRVTSDDIRGFLDHMKGQSMAGIRNVSAYWRSAFINYLRDGNFIMQAVQNW